MWTQELPSPTRMLLKMIIIFIDIVFDWEKEYRIHWEKRGNDLNDIGSW